MILPPIGDEMHVPPEPGHFSYFKRIVLITIGWIFVLVGIAGLVLPLLQGVLFLLVGLVILSKEYRWAGKLVTRLRSWFPKADALLTRARFRATAILENWRSKGVP